MAKIAVFPGSFDPITLGHVDILKRSVDLFDKIIVAIGVNTQKKYLFSLEQRKEWLEQVFKDFDTVIVDTYEGLTMKYCEAVGADYILRGIRSSGDFEYEKTIAHLNNTMNNNLETILMLAKAEYASVSSTIVREIALGGGDVSKFVPELVAKSLEAKL